MEEMDYDSEGTETDPELTLPYGWEQRPYELRV